MDVNFIFWIVILIFSVVIHELSHGYAADILGDPTPRLQGRLTLNPFAHLDLVGSFLLPVLTYNLGGFIIGWAKPVEWNPYNVGNKRSAEAVISAAGPVSNMVLATISGLLLRFSEVLSVPQSMGQFLYIICIVNVSLAIFNLIPIPPLDGSKLLFTALPPHMSRRIRDKFERYGFIVLIVIITAGGSFISPAIQYTVAIITGL